MKVSAITLGCKVNQYESQAMLAQLSSSGFSVCPAGETPDVVLINSCTVTASSDQKVRQTLRRARRDYPDAVIVLTGCMPQAFPETAESLTEADVVLGNSNRASLLPDILSYLSTHHRVVDIAPHQNGESFEAMSVKSFHERTRAFVKIEDGCNRFCSYCIIPYARGRVRSKPLQDLKAEISEIGVQGYREVVLTGINLPAYGQDLGLDLCDAIEVACSVSGIDRVRLGSLEPEQLTPAVISRLARQKKLCPQFHLSLQSGCTATLRRMNRHYTAEEYFEIVQNLRAAFPNAAITTDIMVGFPGETDEEFEQSLAFEQKVGFARAHVFAYSRRPGTRAYEMPDQISNAVKEEHSHRMIAAAQQTKLAFLEKQIGLDEEVLWEREIQPGIWEGYTSNYTLIHGSGSGDFSGKLLPVHISGTSEDWCTGEIQDDRL